MNESRIFTKEQYTELKDIEREYQGTYLGFFYALEYGEMLKIGSTLHPYQRICTLSSNAKQYGGLDTGRVFVSVPHANFRANETKLHHCFADVRKEKSELFKTSIEEVIMKLPYIIEYQSNSESTEETDSYFEKLESLIDPYGLLHDVTYSDIISCVKDAVNYFGSYENLNPEGIELLLREESGRRFLATTWQKVDNIARSLRSMMDKVALIDNMKKELITEGERFISLYEEIKTRADFARTMIEVRQSMLMTNDTNEIR